MVATFKASYTTRRGTILLTWQETHPKRLHVEGDVAGHFPGELFPLGDG